MKSPRVHLAALLLLLVSTRLATAAPPANLIANGGFESGTQGWTIFVPPDFIEKNCQFSVTSSLPHSGSACGKLSSDDFARFCVGHAPFPMTAGARYRLTLWFRADQDAAFAPKAPGLSVRMNFMHGTSNLPGGRIQINAEGVISAGNPLGLKGAMPVQWTRLEVVFEVPPGTDTATADFFSYAKGALYLDDIAIEQVDSATPVTPLANGASYATLTSAAAPLAGPQPPVPPAHPGPVTSDADLLAQLDPAVVGPAAASQPALTGDKLAEVQAAFLAYRRQRSPARWKIMPADEQPALPTPDSALIKDADLVVDHHVLRGAYHYSSTPSVFLGKDIDWLYNPASPQDPAFSNEFTYCMVARTESWKKLADAYWQTHDEKYARAWVEQLEDFSRKNPVTNDVHGNDRTVWRTLDTGDRMFDTWPYCYFHFRDSPTFTPAANWLYARMMCDSAERLMAGLSNTSRTGNWVTAECFGLYTIGAVFPELKQASSWRDTAIQRLGVELQRTTLPDGFESELTPGYHQGAVSQFQGPVVLGELNHLPIPADFRERILAMYRATILAMQQNGQDVCTNDSWIVNARKAAVDSLALGPDPLIEWAISNGKRGQAPPNSTALPYAGFYSMRSGWDANDLFLFFRAGPVGSGHEHQDMLEICLRAWGSSLLTDPGSYPYDRSIWRRFVLNTPAHNCIIVDDKWQHRPVDIGPARPVDNTWVTSPVFDYVTGTYDSGYQKNVYAPIEYQPERWEGPVDRSVRQTRRVLYLRPFYALVLDDLEGTGQHKFEAHWNLVAPHAQLDPTSQVAVTDRENGVNLKVVPLDLDGLASTLVTGQQSPTLLGWMTNDDRNKLSPIPTLCQIKQQAAPASFATLLYPFQGAQAAAPGVTQSPLGAAGGTWARTLVTPCERAEVAVVTAAPTGTISFPSALLAAPLQARAAGLLVRRLTGSAETYVGAWGLSSYHGAKVAFTSVRPTSLAFTDTARPVFYNAEAQPVEITLSSPAAKACTLPPGVWTDLDGREVEPPPLLPRLLDKRTP